MEKAISRSRHLTRASLWTRSTQFKLRRTRRDFTIDSCSMITVTRGHDWMACQPSVLAFSSCFHDTCYPPLFVHPRGLGCFLVPDCPRAYNLTDHAAATRVVNVTNVLTGSSCNIGCIAQVLALRAMVNIYGVDKLRSARLSPNYDNYQVKNLRGQVVVVMHTSLAGRDDTLSELPVPQCYFSCRTYSLTKHAQTIYTSRDLWRMELQPPGD